MIVPVLDEMVIFMFKVVTLSVPTLEVSFEVTLVSLIFLTDDTKTHVVCLAKLDNSAVPILKRGLPILITLPYDWLQIFLAVLLAMFTFDSVMGLVVGTSSINVTYYQYIKVSHSLIRDQ